MNNELERTERKRSWHNERYYNGIFLNGPRIKMLHCRLAGVLAKIQNQVPLDQKSQSLPVVPTRSALLTIFFFFCLGKKHK